MAFEIGSIQRPAAGQLVCGDSLTVVDGPSLFIALADGLGHGPAAAEAARPFCEFAAAHRAEPLDQILVKASEALAHTRGAAGALVRIDSQARSLEFSGIGNIELKSLLNSAIQPFCRPGILGRGRPRVRVDAFPVAAGELLALFSDGVSSRFSLDQYRHLRGGALLGPRVREEARCESPGASSVRPTPCGSAGARGASPRSRASRGRTPRGSAWR